MIAVREESGRIVAEVDGEIVGSAVVRPFIHVPNSEAAYLRLDVTPGWWRRGAATLLEDRAAARARSLGKLRLQASVRDDEADALAFFAARGYVEVDRTRESVLALDGGVPEPVAVPAGYELAPLRPDHDPALWAIACETDADIPSLEPFEEMPFETWCTANLRPALRRDLSVVALREGRLVGFALLEAREEGGGSHAMTAVVRDARGVGLATALKRAQIEAARGAGLRYLVTNNDLPNAAMRRVNEKLGYVRRSDWVDLAGPPIV